MDLQQGKLLWFTSTMSVNMEGRNGAASFSGLYECALDFGTGKCAAPEKIVDVFNPPNEHHRGLDIMNVRIDGGNSTMYSVYFDGERDSFEILSGALDSPPVVLKSFFRSDSEVSNAMCRMQCCGEDKDRHTYYKVEPRDYTIHDGEVFVSWDGFYQNCADGYGAKVGLKWTIGISKIIQSPGCTNTGGDVAVKFEECTVPVSIAFQEKMSRARAQVLGYSGFEAAYTPSKKRIFFLSAMDNEDEAALGGSLFSEIWAISEGENYSKNPKALHKFGKVQIDHSFLSNPVDDVGTIRLRENAEGLPTGLCRTAFDAGVMCYSLNMGDEEINIKRESTFVTADQVKESCTIPEDDHYPITKNIPPVSTGLEVAWDATDQDDSPTMLFFGCYGEINNHGNLTAAFKNGTITQTLPGAYAGSILFGPDEAVQEIKPADFPPPESPASNTSSSPLFGVISFLLVGCFGGFVLKRKFSLQVRAIGRYDRVMQTDETEIQFGTNPSSSTAYVELPAQPLETNA